MGVRHYGMHPFNRALISFVSISDSRRESNLRSRFAINQSLHARHVGSHGRAHHHAHITNRLFAWVRGIQAEKYAAETDEESATFRD